VGGWVDLSSGANGTSLILSVPLPAAADEDATSGENAPARSDVDDAETSAWTAL
jgi:hypothetical protein